jgi:hypothetical protein|tara:strand:- start:98 stop:532 length:435 start_codon:yes stop_codon:yes gene_type:complete
VADAVTTQTILDDGGKNLIVKLTNISDGTGESAVTKVDVSGLTSGINGQACSGISINRIWFSNVGMGFKLFWKATSNQFILEAGADQTDTWDFTWSNKSLPGIPNNAGSGKNGDLALTTVGHSSGDSYSIIIWANKNYDTATTA